MSASDNSSTKCSGPLFRSSFAIFAARTRHLISVAPMRAFSVASNGLSDKCTLTFHVQYPVGKSLDKAMHRGSLEWVAQGAAQNQITRTDEQVLVIFG